MDTEGVPVDKAAQAWRWPLTPIYSRSKRKSTANTLLPLCALMARYRKKTLPLSTLLDRLKMRICLWEPHAPLNGPYSMVNPHDITPQEIHHRANF